MLLFVLLGFLVAVLAQAQGNIPGKSCFDVSIPDIVTSTNLAWGHPKFANNYGLTALVAAANCRDFAISPLPFSGAEVKIATYNIVGTYCQPLQGGKNAILLASHGITLNRTYGTLCTPISLVGVHY